MLATLILRAFEVILFWHLRLQKLEMFNKVEPASFLDGGSSRDISASFSGKDEVAAPHLAPAFRIGDEAKPAWPQCR
jgi:hypothetical protein